MKKHAEVKRNSVFHIISELNLEAETLFHLSFADEADCKLMLCPIILQLLHESLCIVVSFVKVMSRCHITVTGLTDTY